VPEVNPGRPTVSTPATLTPVGYLQFENGVLFAEDSTEFSERIGVGQVSKLSVLPRLECSCRVSRSSSANQKIRPRCMKEMYSQVCKAWAVSRVLRKNLVVDAGFTHGLTKTSTRWETFVGFTYLLPHRLRTACPGFLP
jgi:hypothetical protein